MPAGEYKILWDGTDKNGDRVGSGLYFYFLNTENFNQVKK